MIAEFDIVVDYSQILVYLSTVARPGLIWDDEHVAQGFAYRPGIVGFGLPDHDGACRVQVDTAAEVAVAPAAIWALSVPFDVSVGPVKIGTIFDSFDVAIPVGNYNLVFAVFEGSLVKRESGGDGYAYVIRLQFCPSKNPDFRILKKGGELTTDTVLRRDASQG